jgi:hypothetical protein
MALNQDHATLPKTPFGRTAVATLAETAFHNPTNVVDLLLAADNTDGARITKLYAIPRAAVGTATNCQVYKRVGSTYTLIDSVLMGTVTPSGSVANAKADFGISLSNPLELEPGGGLSVAIGQGIANGVVFRCEGGFYAQ